MQSQQHIARGERNLKRIARGTVPALAALLCVVMSCAGMPVPADAASGFYCRTADEWNALFDRRNRYVKGWLAADGIYSVPTSEDKTVFLFSDTLIGRSDKNGKTAGASMPNHTAAVLRGSAPERSKIKFYYGSDGRRRDAGNLFGEKYWLFDGICIDDTLYILAFVPSKLMKPLCVRLIAVPVKCGEPHFSRYTVGGDIPELCYYSADGQYLYAFGQGITDCTEEDGYVYIYGYKDPLTAPESRDLIVSRIRAADFGDFSLLRYWNGSDWTDDIEKCADIAENVGCEMSCTKLPSGPQTGKYILVYMYATISGRLAYALGDTPCGPFSGPVFFYDAPENGAPAANGTATLYTYNAKAHPALSSEGELLISYNVSSSGEQYTTDYHPRFLWLTYDADAAAQRPQETKTGFALFFEKLMDFLLRFSSLH